MKTRRSTWLMVLLVCGTQAIASEKNQSMAGVENPARARVNYMLNCQGCHGPTGAGLADGTVPDMSGYLARYLHVEGGREFLVQVPGSANAGISAEALAEVLNWMLSTMDAEHLPSDFAPYRAEEVEALRLHPLQDVVTTRAALLTRLADLDLEKR